MASRPPTFRGPRGETLIPIEYAQALADERDQLVSRLQRIQRSAAPSNAASEIPHLRSALRAAESEREDLLRLVDELDRERKRNAAPDPRLAELESSNEQLREALQAARDDLAAVESEAAATRQTQRANLRLVSDPKANEAAYKARAERLQADLANVRRHAEANIEKATEKERIARLADVADLHDALTRALSAADGEEGPWVDGIAALQRKAEGLLRKAGAAPLGLAGEPFDPAVHEAIGAAPSSPEQDGHVLHVEQSGWQLESGALVRAARVIVGKA